MTGHAGWSALVTGFGRMVSGVVDGQQSATAGGVDDLEGDVYVRGEQPRPADCS